MSQSFSPAEIQQLRLETDGTQVVTHLNSAGAALPPNPVRDRVIDYLKEEALYGAYEMAAKYKDALQNTYHNIAELINCQASEIALVENATIAWNLVFSSIPFEQGDVLLTSEVEYGSNFINYLKVQNEKGVQVKVIPSDDFGMVDVVALENMLNNNKVKLISVTHIPTNGGLINPVEAIGKLAAKHGVLFLIDSCQSIGQLPMDVQQLHCSFLTATGRKFLRGPRGTGFLYVNQAVVESLSPPYLDLHSAFWYNTDQYRLEAGARRFENWENNKALRLGLSTAVRYALDVGLDRIWQRIQYLGDYCRQSLDQIPGIRVLDLGREKCGIVTFQHADIGPEKVQATLLQQRINTSVSPWPYTLIDMKKRQLEAINRASVHYFNTEEEVDLLANTLRALNN